MDKETGTTAAVREQPMEAIEHVHDLTDAIPHTPTPSPVNGAMPTVAEVAGTDLQATETPRPSVLERVASTVMSTPTPPLTPTTPTTPTTPEQASDATEALDAASADRVVNFPRPASAAASEPALSIESLLALSEATVAARERDRLGISPAANFSLLQTPTTSDAGPGLASSPAMSPRTLTAYYTLTMAVLEGQRVPSADYNASSTAAHEDQAPDETQRSTVSTLAFLSASVQEPRASPAVSSLGSLADVSPNGSPVGSTRSTQLAPSSTAPTINSSSPSAASMTPVTTTPDAKGITRRLTYTPSPGVVGSETLLTQDRSPAGVLLELGASTMEALESDHSRSISPLMAMRLEPVNGPIENHAPNAASSSLTSTSPQFTTPTTTGPSAHATVTGTSENALVYAVSRSTSSILALDLASLNIPTGKQLRQQERQRDRNLNKRVYVKELKANGSYMGKSIKADGTSSNEQAASGAANNVFVTKHVGSELKPSAIAMVVSDKAPALSVALAAAASTANETSAREAPSKPNPKQKAKRVLRTKEEEEAEDEAPVKRPRVDN